MQEHPHPPLNMSRNTTDYANESGVAPYDIYRDNRPHELLGQMEFPASYTQNSVKEEAALAILDKAVAQYVQLFPHRLPMLLFPKNECGHRKPITGFVRPTSLKREALYDYNKIARFVADYICYEPLDDPTAFPDTVISPSTVMAWQVGNCLEMSLLLCSLLTGNGYDAYVCLGWAVKHIVENDLSGIEMPTTTLPDEVCSSDERPEPVVPSGVHMGELKVRPLMVSEYDKKKKQLDRLRLEEGLCIDISSEAVQGVPPKEGSNGTAENSLVHAWVLVLPSTRGHVEAPFFIEPSTGAILSIDHDIDARYIGIRSIFSHQNIFMNLEPSRRPSLLKYDLRDLSQWEGIYFKELRADTEENDHTSANTMTGGRITTVTEAIASIGESGMLLLDAPTSFVSEILLSRAQEENVYPGQSKEIVYSNGKVHHYAPYAEKDLRIMMVTTPDDVNPRVGCRHIFFKYREDLLRRRLILPPPTNGSAGVNSMATDPRAGMESAASHNTGSGVRVPYRMIRNWYAPGRKKEAKVEGLREFLHAMGVQRTMKFYWKTREDGLVMRQEKLFSDNTVQKIKEFYRGRDDKLVYRSATFEKGTDLHQLVGLQYAVTASATARDGRRFEPIRMSEKFERNAALPVEEDIEKRTYLKPLGVDGELWVHYHYAPYSIIRPYRLFPKNADRDTELIVMSLDGALHPKVVTLAHQPMPNDTELGDQLRFLVAKEQECLQELKTKAEEFRELLVTIDTENKVPARWLSVYDVLRNRPRESEAEMAQMRAEEARRAESRKDYLAPYIAKLEIAKMCRGDYSAVRLSADQAKQVRDDALRDLKERLIQRGQIMQNRMDNEREELNRRQMIYQKNLDAATSENLKESEEFARFCKEATWRMRILDERLSKHIDHASDRYAQMAQRLAEDKRLAALYTDQ